MTTAYGDLPMDLDTAIIEAKRIMDKGDVLEFGDDDWQTLLKCAIVLVDDIGRILKGLTE